MNRARERLREARHRRDRREVRQLGCGGRVEYGARSHRVDACLGRRRAAIDGGNRGGTGRKLHEAEASQAERRAALARDAADEIVRRTTRGADDERLSCWGKLTKKGSRGIEPGGRGRREDYTEHSLHAFFRTPCRTLGIPRRLPRTPLF